MSRVLFDYPWSIADAWESQPALKHFNDWVRKYRLDPVPFLSSAEYYAALGHMDRTKSSALVARIAYDYVRWTQGGHIATPIGGRRGNSDTWCEALGEALGDLSEWREPQIALISARKAAWPNTPEIAIERDGHVVGDRVVFVLDEYENHPYAASDYDPWDLQRCHRPGTDGRLAEFPCRLPKHPSLEHVPLADLQRRMDTLSEAGWCHSISGKDMYFYFPPTGWRFTASKEDWRNSCKTFPRAEASGGKGSGWRDRWERIWIWDLQKHTHWDVELPTRNREDEPEYVVISHTGDLIKRPR